MANRYDVASVAKFNPLSFQELSAAPLMQRQKHDQLIAQQEILRQNLAKTNPHEKYYDEAVRLKNELNDQITSQAESLAKEGVNPNSQADFLKLNRNYQETMSPTGKLGMINAHNVNLQSTYKNYIDEAIKAGQSPAIAKIHADQAIQKHMQQPLYDERGRVVDFSAGNAAPKYIDNVKWINELASKVGFTQSNWAQASSGISKTADGRFVVNESAKGMTKDNIENLNRLAQAANREVSDPASEIRQNIDYNFKNPQTELDNMLNQLYARRERESGITDRNKSYGSVDWNKIEDTPNNPGFEKIPYGIENTSGSTDLSDRINSIGGKSIGKALSYSYDVLTGNKPQAQTKSEFDKARSQVFLKPEDVLQGGELTIYNNAKKQVSKNTPGFNKLSVTEQNKLIAKKASKDILTFSPIVIKPTVKSVGALIPGVQKGADIKSIGNSMLDDAVGGARILYDVETGEPISKDDVKENIKGMSLYGVTAPHNLKTQKMTGATSDQKVSPIIATIVDDKGVKRQVYVSRTGTELKSPEFQKIKSANSVFNGVVNNMNTQVRITDKNSNMYGSKVKYDSSITDGYPIIIISPNGKPERISLDEFQNDAL